MIGMTPYEAFYGRRCITLHCWHEPSNKLELGLELTRETTEKIKLIQAGSKQLMTAKSHMPT